LRETDVENGSFIYTWMNTSKSTDQQWNERSNAKGTPPRDTESMFHLLFERTADAVWLFDPGTATVVDCNEAAAALMRCRSRADLVGKRAEELSPQVQPDGSPTVESVARRIAETLKRGNSRFEWTARRFDGTEVPLEVNATAIERDGKPVFVLVSRDITERKEAEAALLESEARFRSLFERSADAMSLFDPQTGRFIESNEAFVRRIGAPSREALRNVSPAKIWPERQPDGQLSIEKAEEMAKLALTQGSHRFEWLSRQYDGSELPLDIVMTAVPFGERTLLFVVSRDISEHKRAEREIRDLNASLEKRVAERTIELVRSNDQLKGAEEKLRKHSEQVQKHRDVLLDLAQSDKSNLDKALQKICSLSAATLDVARVSYWSLQENDSAIACEVLYLGNTESFDEQFKGARLGFSDCPAYFEALAAKRPIVADRVLRHPATNGLAENYLKPLGISSMLDAPVWVCGEVVGVLCHEHIGPARPWSAEEIDFVSALAAMVSLALEESNRARSEHLLRESEEKFRALFEGTSQAVVLHDENGILEANPSWLRLLGYSRLDDVVGKHPAELSAPIRLGGEHAEALARKHIANALANGSARFEWMILRRDGAELPMEVFLTRIYLGGRKLIQAVCNDITQRKQAETELVRTLAKEKELGQLRSNFVSMVSHEFRTPLGIIQSSAEILEDYLDQLEPAERKDHLQSIRKNTRRMAGLMEEVLLIGSFDAGKMEFKPVPLELRIFVRRLVDEVLSATNRRCPIELLLGEMPAEIQADERLLQHIFMNLLTNAVKYSDAGEVVRFEIGCAGTEIVCAIHDQGIGIPKADREWLFRAFHRGRNVSDRPGTGLGLVIVKRCVDLYGGKIKVESKLSEGTAVTVRLPI
jgi:PAS domain S-box-containing protein